MEDNPQPDFGLPKALLTLEFGGRTVQHNLCAALARGDLLQDEQGCLRLPDISATPSGTWLYWGDRVYLRPSCRFLSGFLFDIVYGKAAVPQGCHDCYKVKVCPGNFQALLAVRQLSRGIPCNSKCGPEVNHFFSQELYGGFFYCQGLDHAHVVYRQVRERVDQTAVLGPGVTMRIKRGCTPYEIHCGPSNLWTFRPEQTELEARLLAQFVLPQSQRSETEFATLMRWVEIAHAIGDNSYLEFTKGRRVYPATVDYAP